MKSILKTMASMLLVAAFAATAVSCSKDDDDNKNNSPLIGKWEYRETTLTYIVNGKSFDANIAQNEYHILVFDEDWRWEEEIEFKEEGVAYTGTYTVLGSALTVYNDTGGEFTVSFSISGNTLYLTYPDEVGYEVLREIFGDSFEADDVEALFIYRKMN